MNDNVNHPSHYTSGDIECIDAIRAALGEKFEGFLIGNVIKYCWRHDHKNGLEDLKKAQWYLDEAISEAKKRSKCIESNEALKTRVDNYTCMKADEQ